MKIKFSYAKKEDIPAEFVSLYGETKVKNAAGVEETAWVLECEGAVALPRFKEFRDNNVRLQAEIKELREQYEGIDDPERARELLVILKDVKDTSEAAKILKAGGIEPIIEQRTKAMKAEHQRTLDKLTGERDSYLSRLNDLEISQAAVTEAQKLGLKSAAVLDVTMRAKQVFRIHEGKVVAFEADGKTVIFGKAGTDPLSIAEWVNGLAASAPHLFEPNSGGGASGGGTGGSPDPTANPFLTGNVTEQMKLFRKDRALYDKLQAQAKAEAAKAKAAAKTK